MARKPRNHRKRYTRADLRRIKSMARTGVRTPEIARRLGRTEDAIRSKADESDISLKPKDPPRKP